MALKNIGGRGRNAFKQSTERPAAPKDEDLLKLQDGEKVKVRLLQELDFNSDQYSDEMGVADYQRVYQGPGNRWNKTTIDTTEIDGDCLPKQLTFVKGNMGYGWKFKDLMFVNVLVIDEEGNESVKYMKNNLNERATEGPAIEAWADDNDNTVTDQWFVYSRKGQGKEGTSYTFSPVVKNAPELKPVETYKDQLIDLTTKYNYVPYAEQEAYFQVTEDDRKEKEKVDLGGGKHEWVVKGSSSPASPSNQVKSADNDTDEEW